MKTDIEKEDENQNSGKPSVTSAAHHKLTRNAMERNRKREGKAFEHLPTLPAS